MREGCLEAKQLQGSEKEEEKKSRLASGDQVEPPGKKKRGEREKKTGLVYVHLLLSK